MGYADSGLLRSGVEGQAVNVLPHTRYVFLYPCSCETWSDGAVVIYSEDNLPLFRMLKPAADILESMHIRRMARASDILAQKK